MWNVGGHSLVWRNILGSKTKAALAAFEVKSG